MGACSCDDSQAMRSRLAASLCRLRQDLHKGTADGEVTDAMYREWQKRWAGRREELVHRLRVIDMHLKELIPCSEDSPRLVVVGGAEDEAAASTGRYDEISER